MNKYYYYLTPKFPVEGEWEWSVWKKGAYTYLDMKLAFGTGNSKADAEDRAVTFIKNKKKADVGALR